jgi:hypothetical protein
MHEPPAAAENAIEIRIDDISQLFHTLDPFPFRERDLDKDAEEFVSWAREQPADQPFRIVVHLPEAQASTPEAHEIAAAITGYFGPRADPADDHREPALGSAAATSRLRRTPSQEPSAVMAGSGGVHEGTRQATRRACRRN